MVATIGTGCVGTGVYMMAAGGESPRLRYDVWLCVLFVPLVPLVRWHAEVASHESTDGQALSVTVLSRARMPLAAIGQRFGKAAVVLALVFGAMTTAAWTVGVSWASPLLTGALGWFLSPSLIGKLSMALETGVGLAGGAVPIAVLMFLDARTPRLGVRAFLRSERESGAEVNRAA